MLAKKPIRLLLVIGGSLTLLIIGLLGYASYRITDVKEPLIALMKDHIDGELKIDSASVVFFPVGIDLKGVTLYAPGEETPSTTIKKVKLRFSLFPLIQKKIEADLTVLEPKIYLRQDKKGRSNMAQIFAPLMAGEKKDEASKIDQFWWKRIAVNRLTIKDAYFKSTRSGSKEVTELNNVRIEADRIRFESGQKPADIKISYLMPRISKTPMVLETQLQFQEQSQAMKLNKGKFLWGPVAVDLTGEAKLPGKKNKEVQLDFQFQGEEISFKKLNKILTEPLPVSGVLQLKGSVQGSAFEPILNLDLDAKSLQVKDTHLNNFHARLQKKGKPLEIKEASMGVYGGSLSVQGKLISEEKTSADLHIKMKGLSLAAMSGKKGSNARLSGGLKIKSPQVDKPLAYSGGGSITVGPFPLPVIDLRNKIRVAEILSAGTSVGQMVNVGMLSNSSNVIGNQIHQVKASVSISHGNLSLHPFNMGNGHFNAGGNARIMGQKTIQGSGTFHLNRGVTSQLIRDRLLRNALTNGSGKLSLPFTISGPLGDPNVSVDSGSLKSQMAKATLIMLQKQALSGLQPDRMLGEALKGTPMGDPNNPLGQILGAKIQQPSTQQNTRTTRTKTSPSTKTQPKSTTGNSVVDQLLFGK